MSRKICFVAMGFGKKMDYRNSKEVDLDIIYKKVIKNLFDSLTEYELIRADEISGSEIIDVSMYSLLLKADLVIADTPEGLREKLSENDFAQVHLQGESLEIINKYFES